MEHDHFGHWDEYECQECGELYMAFSNLNTGSCPDCENNETGEDGLYYDADGNGY